MHPIAKFSTATGEWWLPADNDVDIVIKAMKAGDFFERDIVEAASEFIRPGLAVLDIGSNFGQMAVAFSRLTGPAGTVHAFEADAFVFGLLERNIKENGCHNIVAHPGAVWHDDGLTLFYPEPDFERFGSYGSYGIDMKATSGREVRSFTIDSLNIEGPVSFIKVDIQGSDLFALMGARKTIARDRPAIIFEYEEQFQNEFGTSFEDYKRFIRDVGYVLAGEVGGIAYVRNFIALPRADTARGRLSQSARQISSRRRNGRWPWQPPRARDHSGHG